MDEGAHRPPPLGPRVCPGHHAEKKNAEVWLPSGLVAGRLWIDSGLLLW